MECFYAKVLRLKCDSNEIPKYVKNKLELNGLNNMDTLSQMNDDVIL